jgi:hypothetical protein
LSPAVSAGGRSTAPPGTERSMTTRTHDNARRSRRPNDRVRRAPTLRLPHR